MTVSRLVWIVVVVLLVAVAFTGGVALATVNARRVALTSASARIAPSALMRGYANGAYPGYGMMRGGNLGRSSFGMMGSRALGRGNKQNVAPRMGRLQTPAGRPGGWR